MLAGQFGSTFSLDPASLSRPMKTLAVSILCLASVALADDFKTIDGKEYKNVTVKRVESDGIVLTSKSGISKVYFAELPKEVQERFEYGAGESATPIDEQVKKERAKKERAEKERAERERTEKERAERERTEKERSERERHATANLTKSEREFDAAESRAAQNYKSGEKGTLSGQIFVATKSGENFKLGAVQVSLFARDAIDVLLAGLKEFANAKIEEPRLAAKETGEQQAQAAVQQAQVALQQAQAVLQQAQAAVPQAQAAVPQAEAIQQQAKAAEQQAEMTEKINWDAYQKTPGWNEARIAAEGSKAAVIGSKAAADAASQALNAARQRVYVAQQGVSVAQQGVSAAQQGVSAAQRGIGEARQRRADLLRQQQASYYSGSFYFSHLRSPIQTAETDAEGKFMIEVPPTGKFVIAARGDRILGQKTENYYWLQPVSLDGQQQHIQNLSNNNLTSATGTSALILTKD
jgi:hypothetical protein